MFDFWQMSMREYMLKINGYNKNVKIRRMELRAIAYPSYVLLHKANFKGTPLKPEEFLPIDGKAEKEEIVDRSGLLKKAFYAYNPHLKPK